jgi:hypothetical protein
MLILNSQKKLKTIFRDTRLLREERWEEIILKDIKNLKLLSIIWYFVNWFKENVVKHRHFFKLVIAVVALVFTSGILSGFMIASVNSSYQASTSISNIGSFHTTNVVNTIGGSFGVLGFSLDKQDNCD